MSRLLGRFGKWTLAFAVASVLALGSAQVLVGLPVGTDSTLCYLDGYGVCRESGCLGSCPNGGGVCERYISWELPDSPTYTCSCFCLQPE